MSTTTLPPSALPPSEPTPPGLPDDRSVLGRAGSENFTVASKLLPRAARAHLLAFYGYARLVDEIGDSYDGDRTAALDWVDRQVDRALVAVGPLGAQTRDGLHPLVAAATASVQSLGADPAPLRDLVEANRVDQERRTYETFDELLGYCRLSAAPVGRLVLAAFGASTPERVAWSDAICAGLQLAEHWQDVAEDRAAGRIYLPASDRARFGVGPDDLCAGRRAAPPLRGLLAFEAARARRLLVEGTPLVASLTGRPRVAVAGFVAGGHAALDALAAAHYDPLMATPRPAVRQVAWHTGRLLLAARRGDR